MPDFYFQIGLVFFLMLLVCSICILAWVPPISRDALTHHLVVPKLYLQHGGMYEIPSIVFSYYPMNLDFLYMVPLYLRNDIAPKFIHFIFALLTTWLIYSYLKKRLNSMWGLIGGLFFLSLPIIIKLSITVYVDLGLVFFSTASLLNLIKWIDSRFQIKFLMLSAVCCGLALGTKYNGLIVLFVLTVFIPLLFIRTSKRYYDAKNPQEGKCDLKIQFKAIGFAVIFCTVALLIFSPWMVRNYIWQENPIYPLYNNLFNPSKTVSNTALNYREENSSGEKRMQTSRKSSKQWSPFAIRKIIYGESLWQIALIPLRIFFQGQDDNPKYFDGKLNPFLLFLPLFAFFQLKNNMPALKTEKKIFISFAILYFLYVFFQTNMRIRYITPIIPPLVILATLGLHQIFTMANHHWKKASRFFLQTVAMVLVVSIFLPNVLYAIKQFKYVEPFSYISGRVTRDTYIQRYRPEYSVMQYANQYLPDSAKILGVFIGNRRYYCDRELTVDMRLLKRIIKESDVADNILTELQRKKITHLLIRYDLFNQWTNRQFGDREKQVLKLFFSGQVKELLSKDGYGLYALS